MATTDPLIDQTPDAIPILAVASDGYKDWLAGQPPVARAWLESTGFEGEAGTLSLLAGEDGALARVLVGIGSEPIGLWTFAGLPRLLPAGAYRIEAAGEPDVAGRAALGWALGAYRFERYKKAKNPLPRLAVPEGVDRAAVASAANATTLVRDLVNTPAEDMGPEELAEAARTLGRAHKARVSTIVGETLLKRNYPAIHAVGRASTRAPRLIDLTWGAADDPKLTLVGKGVCFDSGGLDLKPAGAMKIMKKDMGGAAHVLGLASMIMDVGLKVRLRVLIPAVENSVSGNALRPMDVVESRSGKTIEIGHTDAEGRVVLADALAEASRERPDLILDFATLTGAARVALGPELPAMFANDDALAEALVAHGRAQEDPLWQLPLWRPYRKMIEGKTADVTNSTNSSFAGAITAALFLQEFVGEGIPWAHFDTYAWNPTARPGRPEGGEAMAMRAAFAAVAARYGG